MSDKGEIMFDIGTECPDWRKSSYCYCDTCVEVADIMLDAILVRDSKVKGTGYLTFKHAEWRSFIIKVRAGEFD